MNAVTSSDIPAKIINKKAPKGLKLGADKFIA
jgi:hypothetical protein